MFDSIIFDLDGTLWDSTVPICESWNVVLKRHAEIKRPPVTINELGECMGLPMYDIAAKLFPLESKEVQTAIMDELCAYENVLSLLSKRYRLFIVSNCQDGYIEAFLKAHRLAKYFDDTECWGRTRTCKGESNKILIKRNNLCNPVYAGDTSGDAESADYAGIPFIYAAYGFGNVSSDKYIAKIDDIKNLPELMEEL